MIEMGFLAIICVVRVAFEIFMNLTEKEGQTITDFFQDVEEIKDRKYKTRKRMWFIWKIEGEFLTLFREFFDDG